MSSERDPFRLVLKSLIAAAAIVLLVIAVLKLLDLLVLVFASVVFGTLIHAFAEFVERHTPLSGKWALAAVLLLFVVIVGGVTWLAGSRMSSDFSQLSQTLVNTWQAVERWVESVPGGDRIVSGLKNISFSGSDLVPRLSSALSVATSVVTDMILLVFGSIFIAADPGLYRRGLVYLFPKKNRPLVGEALCEAGASLRQWILGQSITMVFIGTAVGLALWIAGVPSALALALVAGCLEIIPYFGPILSAVPILAMAASVSQEKLWIALAIVVALQQFEGDVLTPYIHKKVVSLPPAVSVFGVVAGGILFGPIGLIFAAPLLIVTFTLVKRLYVEEALHTPMEIPGRDSEGS